MRVLSEENIAQRYSLDCMTLHELGRVKNASGGVLFKCKLQELAKHDARDLVISLAEIPLVGASKNLVPPTLGKITAS